MKKIYVNDIPDSTTVHSFLRAHTDWVDLMESIKPKFDLPEVLCFTIDNFDVDLLRSDIIGATKIYGDHGWKSANGEAKAYTGFSLVYNPDQIDGLDPHSSTLGTPRNANDKFFWNSKENHQILKNSYFDSYSFNVPTPASGYQSLGVFMQRCLRTRIRSRLSIIHGKHHTEISRNLSWHRDEPIFENLRINIPIQTNERYLFQIENKDPVHLPIGRAYSWDTNVPHRVFSFDPDDSQRIHLVLGFSPWWDYLPDEQAWVQNEYYGKKHPFDMLVDGEIFSGLRVDREFLLKRNY